MESENQPAEIVVCLGSSCFARGNSANLGILKRYLEQQGAAFPMRLAGCLCQDECKQGPNLTIAGHPYHAVTAADLREILHKLSTSARGKHGNS